MKIAILSDIHANFEALQVVANNLEIWRPDIVFVAGDIINRGPFPNQCLQFILENKKEWKLVIGNHEEYVIAQAIPEYLKSREQKVLYQDSNWTYNQIGKNIEPIKNLPFLLDNDFHEKGFIRVTHASMLGTRGGIFPELSDEQIKERIGKPPAVFCVGHTHRPMIRRIDDTLIINAGSVGLPFDGNQQACYAKLTYNHNQWHGKIERCDYDVQSTLQGFFSTGYIDNGGPLVRIMLRELKQARSHLYQWTAIYKKDIVQGKISFENAVKEYIKVNNLDDITF